MIVKSAAGVWDCTTRVTWALCVSVPSVAVIVSVDVPAAMFGFVETVSVEGDPGVLVEVGLKLPVAPLGSPLTLQVTGPL